MEKNNLNIEPTRKEVICDGMVYDKWARGTSDQLELSPTYDRQEKNSISSRKRRPHNHFDEESAKKIKNLEKIVQLSEKMKVDNTLPCSNEDIRNKMVDMDACLVLNFPYGLQLPSKEELVVKCSRFEYINPHLVFISPMANHCKVLFLRKCDAEAADKYIKEEGHNKLFNASVKSAVVDNEPNMKPQTISTLYQQLTRPEENRKYLLVDQPLKGENQSTLSREDDIQPILSVMLDKVSAIVSNRVAKIGNVPLYRLQFG